MVRREAKAPLLLGTADSADVVVAGKYTSGRHGSIWFDKGCWWYRDLGSTNGSRVLRPDQPPVVFPASSAKAPPPAAVELTPGCEIVFTATEEGGPADYPVLLRPRGESAKATPQAPSMRAPASGATPFNAYSTGAAPLARLRIADALGEREILISAGQLPFTIGRDQSQACAVPWDHKTVSGKHLVLSAFEDGGARIRMLGNNGGALGKQRLETGEEALWPWDESLLLGYPPAGELEYRLALIRP
jgi:pSer/pThr/pTyr-binding forkhead associated (FHA) protein